MQIPVTGLLCCEPATLGQRICSRPVIVCRGLIELISLTTYLCEITISTWTWPGP
jgi:hypothetical protein